MRRLLSYFLLALSTILLMVPTADAAKKYKVRYDDLMPLLEPEPNFATKSKWKSAELTYGFLNGTTDISGNGEQQSIRDALNLWLTVSKLSFTELTSNPSSAAIRIQWATGSHGDCCPFDGEAKFDGKANVLAHAFYPEDGDLHLDDAETWTTGTNFELSQPIDLMTVSLHELGHSLGLEHSEDPDSIMYPYYTGSHRFLDIDDILGIQSLYGYGTGLYHLRYANSEGPPGVSFRYGIVLGGKAVIGDWDGDGDQTIGSFYPPGKSFYLRNSNSPGAAEMEFEYGQSEDLPIAGDWDGDGDQTVGVFRPSTSTFYLNNTNANDPADYTFSFGTSGDVPLAGDWNGDGTDSIGVYRPSNRTFYLRNSISAGSADYTFEYGLSAATPVVGDWNDDKVDTIGLFNTSDSGWYLRNSNSAGAANLEFHYGDGGKFTPVTGDWDGDGLTTIGLYQN